MCPFISAYIYYVGDQLYYGWELAMNKNEALFRASVRNGIMHIEPKAEHIDIIVHTLSAEVLKHIAQYYVQHYLTTNDAV